MQVLHTEQRFVNLSPEEVDKVFWKRLEDLSGGMFIKGDDLYVLSDAHPHNGDCDDIRMGSVSNPKFKLEMAAITLKKVLLDTAV